MKLIAPTTYLGNWAFVAPIIIVKFLLNHHPFLLEVMQSNNYCPLPFQAHLKLTKKLFPLDVVACIPPFIQFAKRGIDQF